MTLRKTGDHLAARARRPSGLRLLGFCAVLVVMLLGAFAGSSGAGVANYTGTLYLAGAPSSVSGSYQLVTTAPSATPAMNPVAAVSGAGTIPAATYQYIYVVSNSSARTASNASNQLVVAANSSVSVANVPIGSLVYRQRVSAGLPVGTYNLVSPAGGTTATPFVDDGSINTTPALPQSDTRVQTGVSCATANACGYAEFIPGVGLNLSTSLSTITAAPAIPATCRGWIVDAPGGLSIPAGNWQYRVRIKTNAGATGTALLTVGMWKVNDSGTAVSGGTLIDPTQATSDGAQNLIVPGTQTITYTTPSNVPAFTLATSEHLCVQFWRHQTGSMGAGNGASQRTVSLLGYDPLNGITSHPAPNGFASATLASPADGSSTQTVPTLGATYSDAEGDAGTLTIRLCSDAGCGTELQNSGAMATTNGSTPTWAPTGPLTDNTYYWQAQAKDNPGLVSAWTASRSFVVDTAAPSTSITSSPPALSNSSGGSFSFNASESVTGYQCHLDAAAYAGCSSPFSYSGLSDGAHTFYVKATADLAGNAGTQTSYGWTIDTTAPNTSITSSPSALSNTSSPSFTLSATEPGSTFECNLDSAGFGACPNPQSYSGLADGPHTFQARAIDGAGNADGTPVSYAWTIDATAPDTAIGPTKPAPLTTSTSATFDFSSPEAGSTFECSRDGAAFTSCSSPKTYTGLSDATHTFEVRATDLAGNTDPTPASYSWTVDTAAPNTTIGPTQPPANSASAGATFDFAATEGGSTFQCHLDAAAYGSCTSPASYAGLGDGSHTFFVKATDAAGNTDATPASYGWAIDTAGPATPPLISPADGFLTNAPPQLRATFTDGTPGDSGTIEFQLCSSAAPAGTACAPVVSSATSGSVANGGTGTATPGPLPSSTYHWQARAQDVAGNLSGWSATRSFQIDSSAPGVPQLVAPDDGAWIRFVRLQAVFAKPAFVGTGTVEFRVCSDGACLAIAGTGTSAAVANGETASWSPTSTLRDGLYYWQARAHDAAGNQSGWSATRLFHLDATPPATPTNFNGQVVDHNLTLRWDPPADTLANFYVYVNGVSGASVGETTYEYVVGAFDAGDPRTFAVVAVDRAGNQSPMSKTLAGVPNVVGLTLTQAVQAASARGFTVRRESSIQSATANPGIVVSQDPEAGSVAPQGSAVKVVVSGGPNPPLTLKLTALPVRVVCRAGGLVRLRIRLSEAATLRARLARVNGRALAVSKLGNLPAGSSDVRVRLPKHLARGSYKLFLDATSGTRAARAVVRLKTGSGRVCGSK